MKEVWKSLLLQAGAGEIRHSGRTLFDHLVGTARCLAQWGCEEDVCAAGLFHSVYGTSSFRHGLLAMSDRPALRLRIGQTAEQLVFLFCRAARAHGFLEALDAGMVRDRGGMTTYEVSRRTAQQLLLVELANLYEQRAALDGSALDTETAHRFAARLDDPLRSVVLGLVR
ncbi:DUF6817 domain-containing protein [Burkholderia sp. RS02]|uniref:DUF6817 domain-containing protein n=1 Tax=unclassified Burkholderia TaxID=2613784 RepID=UPI0032181F54